jgi:hypothetical protein
MKRTGHCLGTLALLAILSLAVVSCGGGSGGGGATDPPPAPAAEKAVAKAEANCRTMLKEVKQAAHGVLSRGFKDNLQLLNLGLGRPGLRIAKRMRERQAKLVAAIGTEAYETYVGLFNPIILYAERSIKGAEAENVQVVTPLKEKLTTLGIEQGLVAHQAGLPACEIDFLEAMVRAASP